MGELFRKSQQNLLELTLWERILKVFLKMIRQLLDSMAIDLEQTIENFFSSKEADTRLISILNALHDFDEKEKNYTKIAA